MSLQEYIFVSLFPFAFRSYFTVSKAEYVSLFRRVDLASMMSPIALKDPSTIGPWKQVNNARHNLMIHGYFSLAITCAHQWSTLTGLLVTGQSGIHLKRVTFSSKQFYFSLIKNIWYNWWKFLHSLQTHCGSTLCWV